MSSKTGINPPKNWSLAARLTAWYAISAFLMVLGVTIFLYWALVRSLNQEDDQVLTDKIRVTRAILDQSPQNTEALKQEINEAGQAPQSSPVYLRILKSDGLVEAETPGMETILPEKAFDQNNQNGNDFTSGNGAIYRVLWATGPGGMSIQVGMNRSPEMELLENYRQSIFVVLLLAVFFCSLAGYWIAQNGTRPIHDITKIAGRIRPTNLSERIRSDGLPLELLSLADTINEMLDRLEMSFKKLRQFSADLAHELRTPLNNLQGEFEVALTKSRSPGEYQEAIASGLEETLRVKKLVESLLFLARAEHPQSQISKEKLDLETELRTVLDFYEPSAFEKGIVLIFSVSPGTALVANKALFQRTLGNLIENSLRHTPSKGQIEIKATNKNSSIQIEVRDTGHGIQEPHLAHIFERFYRVDSARTTGGTHSGLGLSIVKSIVEHHGGRINITSQPGHGTIILMDFPGG